jgi:hypothetical protein
MKPLKILFIIFSLRSLNAASQTILGCACPPPCNGYEFNNGLPGCNVNIRWTLYDSAGNVCSWGTVNTSPGPTCIIPCASFAGCTGPFNVAITIIDIDGAAIPVGTPNSIDHAGNFGNTTGSQVMPATSPCTSPTFNMSTLPSGCGADITP